MTARQERRDLNEPETDRCGRGARHRPRRHDAAPPASDILGRSCLRGGARRGPRPHRRPRAGLRSADGGAMGGAGGRRPVDDPGAIPARPVGGVADPAVPDRGAALRARHGRGAVEKRENRRRHCPEPPPSGPRAGEHCGAGREDRTAIALERDGGALRPAGPPLLPVLRGIRRVQPSGARRFDRRGAAEGRAPRAEHHAPRPFGGRAGVRGGDLRSRRAVVPPRAAGPSGRRTHRRSRVPVGDGRARACARGAQVQPGRRGAGAPRDLFGARTPGAGGRRDRCAGAPVAVGGPAGGGGDIARLRPRPDRPGAHRLLHSPAGDRRAAAPTARRVAGRRSPRRAG